MGHGARKLQVTDLNTFFQEHEAFGLKKCSCYGHHQKAQIHSKTHEFNCMSKFGVTQVLVVVTPDPTRLSSAFSESSENWEPTVVTKAMHLPVKSTL